MADPRFYVKPCPPQYLGNYEATLGRQTSNKRDFFTSLGKVGNLEILNSIGGSTIGKGLRTLASISDSVRTGCGSLPTSLGGAIGGMLDTVDDAGTAGINWVFQMLGLSTTMADAVDAFSPDVANHAYGQAKSIYDQIKNGTFDISQIPGYLQDFQNLERLANSIYVEPTSGTDSKIRNRCEASPYAVDLIRRHGSYPFLFVVEFVFTNEYSELGELVFPFVIKQSTRPSVRYQMEDVNYYNFRTKVITRTEFDEMSMTFHDDQQNQSMRFYNAYLRATSPVTNLSTPTEWGSPEERGMDYVDSMAALNRIGSMPGTTGDIIANYYTGSVGTLAGNTTTVLSHIRIYHVFNYGHQANIFTFYRPRMSSLNLSDLDMAGGHLGEFVCKFNYDGVNITTDVDLSDDVVSSHLEQQRANPVYSLKYNGDARSTQGPNQNGFYAPGTQASGIDNTCNTSINTSISLNQVTTAELTIPTASMIVGGGWGGSIQKEIDKGTSQINSAKQSLNKLASLKF